jgi:hypothetical protein
MSRLLTTTAEVLRALQFRRAISGLRPEPKSFFANRRRRAAKAAAFRLAKPEILLSLPELVSLFTTCDRFGWHKRRDSISTSTAVATRLLVICNLRFSNLLT